jgi:hypothetical protein
MAAITAGAGSGGRFALIRQAATTSQTDWLYTPAWARYAIVFLSITTAGTSTIPTFHAADPVLKDDAQAILLEAGAIITAASNHIYVLGHMLPSGTEIADSATLDATSYQIQYWVLPSLLGVQIAATGSTYTLSVEFRK